MKFLILGLLLTISVTSLSSCRGYYSEKPPIRVHINMVQTPKINTQRMSLDTPEGNLAYGKTSDFNDPKREDLIKEDSRIYTGKNSDGSYVSKVPLKVDNDLIQLGREKYDITCAACHGATGAGQTEVAKRGLPPLPKFYEDKVVNMTDGELFYIGTYGVRTMSGYEKLLTPEERWGIVLYIRALQVAMKGQLSDVPENKKASLK